MDRYLFVFVVVVILVMGMVVMGVLMYLLRLYDWNKYKVGGGKEEKKKFGLIDIKVVNKYDKLDKLKSLKLLKYYNFYVIVNNYYGFEVKLLLFFFLLKEELNKK